MMPIPPTQPSSNSGQSTPPAAPQQPSYGYGYIGPWGMPIPPGALPGVVVAPPVEPPPVPIEGINPDDLTRALLRTAGRYDSAQDRAVAIIKLLKGV